MNLSYIRAIFCIVLLSTFISLSNTEANQYNFTFHPEQPLSCDGDNGTGENGAAGKLTQLDAYFNSVTNTFSWTATFEPCNGILPQGYWLVTNNGPNPKGHSGELAIIYFDATTSFVDPTMTVYAYNGKNAADSYKDGLKRVVGDQAPDRILSSLNDSSWIYEKSVQNNPDGTRTFHFVINASSIIHHNPVYPHPVDPWFGIGLDDLIGFWFHPVVGLYTSYCVGEESDPVCRNVAQGQTSRGFLKSLNWEINGWFDKSYYETNEFPSCLVTVNGAIPSDELEVYAQEDAASRALTAIREGTVNNGHPEEDSQMRRCVRVNVGEDVGVVFTGTDNDNRKLKIRYSELPEGAYMTKRDGSPLGSGELLDVPANALMNWTPRFSDAGSEQRVGVYFTDRLEARTRCGVKLCVPKNKPPHCDIKTVTENPQCGGTETYVSFNGSNSFDPEGHALDFEWTTTCVDSYGNPELIEARQVLGLARLTLTEPGKGVNVNCEVKLTISDGYERSSCTAPVNVEGCDLDCEGTPGGTAEYDQCGVCNGTNACLDCEGVPFGEKIVDACGVCGGTNECLDCNGVPNGTSILDACGVCGGNGSTCVTCSQSDITPSQFQMDGTALALRNKVFKATKLLGKADSSAATKKFIKNAKAQADDVYVTSWTLTWTFPSLQTFCEGSSLCITSDNTASISVYQQSTATLRDLALISIKKLRKALHKKGARKKLVKEIKADYNQTVIVSSGLPTANSTCDF